MKYALLADGSRSQAMKGASAFCPLCRGAVRAKCGRIKVHHWAHILGSDCDPWAEPESDWHRDWKGVFPAERVEVAFGPHRADILAWDGTVIELQNSAISPDEIEERERFYRRMIWVINGAKFSDRLFITKHRGKKEVTFRWKNFQPRWLFARKPIFIDLLDRRLSQLLGGQRFTDHFADPSAAEPTGPRILERWSPPEPGSILDPLRLDPSLIEAHDFMQEASILQVLKLYDSGWGIGRGLSLEIFLGRYLGQE